MICGSVYPVITSLTSNSKLNILVHTFQLTISMQDSTTQDDEQSWRKIKLSLERPYKDDTGQPIPTLLDITPDGQFIYEPHEDYDTKLSERFRRIFAERGIDFFDTDPETRYRSEPETSDSTSTQDEENVPSDEAEKKEPQQDEEKLMTPEKLFQMRSEILPRLQYVLVLSL